MKIPLFIIDPTYVESPPVAIRYGIHYNGDYFFEVIVRYSIQGVAYQYSSHMDNKKKWLRFNEYLRTLDVEKRVKIVRRIIKRFLKQLRNRGERIDGVYKFKTSNLFKKVDNWATIYQ